MAQIIVRRGATFALQCTYTPPDGALPDLLDAVITSQIRRKGMLVQELEVSLASDGMSFTVLGGDTSDWPLELSDWDLRIEIDGQVYYTNTVTINVLPTITAAPS